MAAMIKELETLGDEALVDIAFDLRYAKGTGDVSYVS